MYTYKHTYMVYKHMGLSQSDKWVLDQIAVSFGFLFEQPPKRVPSKKEPPVFKRQAWNSLSKGGLNITFCKGL